MVSLHFFNRSRQRTHKAADSKPSLRDGRLSNASIKAESESKYDPTADSDLSYQDALLDLSVRLYMQEEYGSVKPPTGAFRKLMRAIEGRLNMGADHGGQSSRKPAQAATSFLSAFRNALSGQIAARLLPGGVAMALTLGIGLAANAGHALNAEVAPLSQANSIAPLTVNRQIVVTTPSASNLAIRANDGLPDVIGYDPYELLMTSKGNSARNRSIREYIEDTLMYERDRSSPQ